MAVCRWDASKGLEECFLIEIQGGLAVEKQCRTRAGLTIGDFSVSPDQKTAELAMGNNTLKGKVEALKKPLVLFRKTGRREKGTLVGCRPQNAQNGGGAGPQNGEKELQVLEVEAVIRRKAIFTKRPSIHVPQHLVQKPAVTKKTKKK